MLNSTLNFVTPRLRRSVFALSLVGCALATSHCPRRPPPDLSELCKKSTRTFTFEELVGKWSGDTEIAFLNVAPGNDVKENISFELVPSADGRSISGSYVINHPDFKGGIFLNPRIEKTEKGSCFVFSLEQQSAFAATYEGSAILNENQEMEAIFTGQSAYKGGLFPDYIDVAANGKYLKQP